MVAGNNNSQNDKVQLEERGFCAALYENGETRRKESNKVRDFCPLIKEATVAWIDYVVNDFEKESFEVAEALGFTKQLVNNIIKCSRSGYEDFENEIAILLPAIRVSGFDVDIDPLFIFIRQNMILTLHTKEMRRFFRIRRYAETLLRKLPQGLLQNDKITLFLIRIIDENNARNFDHLREIEEQGDKMSEDLANPKTPRDILGPKIHQMKHALITYLGGLWATVDALNSIRYGDPDLLTDDSKILDRLSGLVGELHSQIGLAEHMSEVLASGLEVLQSIYNNQLQILNNRLALLAGYLAIFGTALLVPNTIATVLGNTMFNLTAKDVYWYIPLIVISTLVATIFAWWAVNKMKLLPRRPE
jgi:magnesium transporter